MDGRYKALLRHPAKGKDDEAVERTDLARDRERSRPV